jgi:hypothetical protein
MTVYMQMMDVQQNGEVEQHTLDHNGTSAMIAATKQTESQSQKGVSPTAMPMPGTGPFPRSSTPQPSSNVPPVDRKSVV